MASYLTAQGLTTISCSSIVVYYARDISFTGATLVIGVNVPWQSPTAFGASFLMNAEQYPGPDPESQERVEKRTRAQDQSLTAERQLKEVGLDFGMQFAASAPPAYRNHRVWTERTSSARKGPGE